MTWQKNNCFQISFDNYLVNFCSLLSSPINLEISQFLLVSMDKKVICIIKMHSVGKVKK